MLQLSTCVLNTILKVFYYKLQLRKEQRGERNISRDH